MISLNPKDYLLLGLGIIVPLLGIALWVQGVRVDKANLGRERAEYALRTLETRVKVEGVAAEARVKARVEQDKQDKEKADAANKLVVAGFLADIARLRDERDRARGSGVPAAPPGSLRPDLACFDRAEYQRAYGELVAKFRGLADEGTAATLNLNTAKDWAQSENSAGKGR